MKEWILAIFGYTYLLNINTGEVHNLKNKTVSCRVHLMSKQNKKYLTRKQFKKIMGTTINKKLINGCRWCMTKYDLG